MTSTSVGRQLTTGEKIVRKLKYGPFWENVLWRAARSAVQADVGYITAKQLHILTFAGVPYLHLAIVAGLAALFSFILNGAQIVSQAHNLSLQGEYIASIVKTFVAAFASVSIVGIDTVDGAANLLEHALFVAVSATFVSLLTIQQTVKANRAPVLPPGFSNPVFSP